jgi:hypothetical protein
VQGLQDLVVSSDGHSVYGTAKSDEAIARFSRDPASGALTYAGCLTGNSSSDFGRKPCKLIPGALPRGLGSGLAGPTDIVLSPSGRSVFVAASRDAAIAVLGRNPVNGDLSWAGCVTARRRVAAVARRCRLVRTANGVQRLGFGGFSSLAIAGGSLFASASRDGAISRFSIGG